MRYATKRRGISPFNPGKVLASPATDEDNIHRCYFPGAVISIVNTIYAPEDKFACP